MAEYLIFILVKPSNVMDAVRHVCKSTSNKILLNTILKPCSTCIKHKLNNNSGMAVRKLVLVSWVALLGRMDELLEILILCYRNERMIEGGLKL